MSTERFRRKIERGERGVALVEFALVFPVFMTLVLGMFSGGLAYDRKVTLTNAAREGARYGATLAPATFTVASPIDDWTREVVRAVEQNADGDLDAGVPGRSICVAFVHPKADSGPHNLQSHMLTRTTGPDPVPAAGSAARCFADGGLEDERRVQVQVSRRSDIQLLFFKIPVTLTARSVMRMEATKF